MTNSHALPSTYACTEACNEQLCQNDLMAAIGDITCEGVCQRFSKQFMRHKSAAHLYRGILHSSRTLLPCIPEVDDLHSKVLLIVLLFFEHFSSPGSLHRA